MARVISQPDKLCLTSMLADIVFETTSKNGKMRLSLTVDGVKTELLSETLWPDNNGRVTISGLSPLLSLYTKGLDDVDVIFSCSFEDAEGVASIEDVTLLYGTVDIGMSTSEFLSTHFLTILDGEKLTSLNRQERLSWYGTDRSIIIEADLRLPNGNCIKGSWTRDESDSLPSYHTVDISPRKVQELLGMIGGRVLGYTVRVGQRYQSFRVIEEQILPEPSLVFENSFGCEEFLHCTGTLKRQTKYERSQVRIGGKIRQYDTREECQFTANTGWMNDAMCLWAEDLFRSEDIWLWRDGSRSKKVVINDSKSEWDNEEDSLIAYEFTYTYAQKIHNVRWRRKRERIFTEQFEDIYN